MLEKNILFKGCTLLKAAVINPQSKVNQILPEGHHVLLKAAKSHKDTLLIWTLFQVFSIEKLQHNKSMSLWKAFEILRCLYGRIVSKDYMPGSRRRPKWLHFGPFSVSLGCTLGLSLTFLWQSFNVKRIAHQMSHWQRPIVERTTQVRIFDGLVLGLI